MGISIGMVGLGAFGSGFVDLFKSHPLVDRIAFCDMEKDRVKHFAESDFMKHKFDPKDVYYSLDDICKSDLDAIVIITQPWLHAPQAIQVMESGKSVFSAVPISSVPDGTEILDWCDKIINTVKTTGKHYMLGETTYYHPEVMFMRRQAAAGNFGTFISANAEYAHDYSGAWGCSLREVYEHRTASTIGSKWPRILKEKYLDKGIVPGPMHYPTHSVSGPVSVMKAHALKVSAIGVKPTGYDDHFEKTDGALGGSFANETGFFHMSNGSVFTVREYREITSHGYKINVFGTCGTWRDDKWYWTRRGKDLPIDQTPEHGEQELTPQEMRDELPHEVTEAFMMAEDHSLSAEDVKNMDFTPKGHGGSHPYLVHEFVSAIAENRIPAINAWEASRYMAMGVMAHKSALKDGEMLDVPDWGNAPE